MTPFGGLAIKPSYTMKISKVWLYNLSQASDMKYIYLWTKNNNGEIKYTKYFTQIEVVNSYGGNEDITWDCNGTTTLTKGGTYFLTFHSTTPTSTPETPRCGYAGRTTVKYYKSKLPSDCVYILSISSKNSQFSESNIDTEYTHDFKLYLENDFKIHVLSSDDNANKFNEIDSFISSTQGDISDIKSQLDTLSSYDSFKESTESRLDEMDENVSDIIETLNDTKSDLGGVTERITTVETFKTEAQENIRSVSDDVSSLNERLEDDVLNDKLSSNTINSFFGDDEYLFNNFNPSLHTTSGDQVYTIVFSKKHFYRGSIVNITIPHDGLGDGSVRGGYLAIQVYKEVNNKDEIPTIYYSDNSSEYDASKKCYKFNFTNCILDDYAKVHLTVVRDKLVVPTYSPTTSQVVKQEWEDSPQVSKIRISSIKLNGSNNESDILGVDDICGVYWSASGEPSSSWT